MSHKPRYRLKFNGALGDIVAFTAVVRDFALSNPDIDVEVDAPFPDVFLYSSRLTNWRTSDAETIEITDQYYRDEVQRSSHGLRRHFIQAFHEIVRRKTNRPCNFTEPRPELFLSPIEKRTPPVGGGYWVLFAGGKTDITIKHWELARYQQLVNNLSAYGLKFVQTGGRHDVHPPLVGVLNLVGWGKARELFRLIYHAEGVICPITSGMHIAAALRKPCVVIGGGREEPWWEAYNNDYGNFPKPVDVPHRFLHTYGALDCCRVSGCWKKLVGDCVQQTLTPSRQTVPRCMDMISVADVAQAVLSYYPGGVPERATVPLVDLTKEDPEGCQTGRCPPRKPLSEGDRAEVEKIGNRILASLRAGMGLGRPQEGPQSPPEPSQGSGAVPGPERPTSE